MNEDNDEDSFEYYSDYEDCDEGFNEKISHNPSPYSRTPLPDFSEREIEASRLLKKWLKSILEKSDDDIVAFLEKKQISENEETFVTREDCSIIRLEVSNISSVEGDYDQQGKLHGEAEIRYNNGDYFSGQFEHGSIEGKGGLIKRTGDKYYGMFSGGALTGLVREELDGGHMVRIVHYRTGVRHGPFLEYQAAARQFLSVGRFDSGRKSGVCWTARRGGGYLVGEVVTPAGQEESLHIGNVIFLYPDLITAIQGQFSHGRLISGSLAHLTKVGLTGFLPELEVCAPLSVQANELYHYQPAGSLSISPSPMVRDPFECRYVFVSESRTGEGAGEGLFAKTDIPQGQLCALFNGVRQRRLTGQYLQQTDWSDYRIGCGAETDLDILPGQETLANYRATLAHKVCHSFNNNCSFAQFWHPRFGNIMSVVADRDIQAGEELSVSYNYKLDCAPLWYVELWTSHCSNN